MSPCHTVMATSARGNSSCQHRFSAWRAPPPANGTNGWTREAEGQGGCTKAALSYQRRTGASRYMFLPLSLQADNLQAFLSLPRMPQWNWSPLTNRSFFFPCKCFSVTLITLWTLLLPLSSYVRKSPLDTLSAHKPLPQSLSWGGTWTVTAWGIPTLTVTPLTCAHVI